MNNPQTVRLNDLAISGFPPREALVVGFTALGLSSKEIARQIDCSPRNVEALRDAAKNRVHATNTPHLISTAFRCGMLRFMSLVLTTWLGTGLQPIVTDHIQSSINDDQMRRSCRAKGRGRTLLLPSDGLHWDCDIMDFLPTQQEGALS